MNSEDAEEYTQSLGQIVAGSWRQVALAKRLRVPEALGLTTEQWVTERLGGYIKLTIANRRQAVLELSADGFSSREIGEVLGIAHATALRAGANVPSNEEKHNKNNGDAARAGANVPDPLDDPEIHARVRKLALDFSQERRSDMRLRGLKQKVGVQLMELRKLVEAMDVDWWQFYQDRFQSLQRTRREGERLMSTAKENL